MKRGRKEENQLGIRPFLKQIKPEDRIMETYINNLSEGAPEVIHGHLQDADFLYTVCMLEGTKLDPPLISALVKRWRQKTHTFHLLCSECTITREDVSLQLGLPVNGDDITGQLLVSIGV
ncbi:serine/threonine-protein phosphatase 7 long form homolog [Gossypium raimondii]|uniref:serine/threonine-protein phosphatase 7 long form homolog n=1 Tax=Gossypium raimondii TaxID=29730 RepID=UPI00227D0418|nr:serine/threonine-protein phosphatase 7 long form homolog [Gossypium raimondii]